MFVPPDMCTMADFCLQEQYFEVRASSTILSSLWFRDTSCGLDAGVQISTAWWSSVDRLDCCNRCHPFDHIASSQVVQNLYHNILLSRHRSGDLLFHRHDNRFKFLVCFRSSFQCCLVVIWGNRKLFRSSLDHHQLVSCISMGLFSSVSLCRNIA